MTAISEFDNVISDRCNHVRKRTLPSCAYPEDWARHHHAEEDFKKAVDVVLKKCGIAQVSSINNFFSNIFF